MIKSSFRTTLSAVAAMAMIAAAVAAGAQELRQHVTAGAVDIYYGFLPAEIAGRSTAAHDTKPMHGAPRRGDYHLIVALFDRNGQRITEAEVDATVGELGLAGTRRALDAMAVGDATTFGNYFPMQGAGPYRVTLEIRLPGARRPIEARFDHQHR